MSFSQKYFENPIGRNFLFSAIISSFLTIFALYIAIAENTDTGWYSFMYEDINLPEEDRFNVGLLLLETFVFIILFFFLLIAFGSFKELRNDLPSWGEVTASAFLTLLLAFTFPRISIGGGLSGTEEATGFNHFTGDMRTWLFWLVFLGVILITLYFIYSDNNEDNTE